ncbi:MAG: Gmad2 immunoglobulin-like domain-containing protein [Actinobacteria bacterium]|nr:Gmad2 immunoglobulin-like domain-containing protein [Actinomycetota bacterium]
MRTVHVLFVALAMLLAACGGTGEQIDPGTPSATETVDMSPEETGTASESETAPSATCGTYEPESQVTDEAVLVISTPSGDSEFPPGSTVSGCTNAFEASFQWELLDAGGEVVASSNEMASCGSGCLGIFQFPVDYSVEEAQEGTLRLFVESAEDGSTQMEEELLVHLVPE